MIFLRHELVWFCLVQVSTTQFCSFPACLMGPVSDGTNVPISPAPASSSKFGSLMALAPTSMAWAPAPALEVQRMLSFRNLYTAKRRSRKFLLLRIGCPAWIHISLKHLGILRLDLQRWNRISAPSLHVCARSRHMQPQHQMYPVRQDLGLHSNKLTAPQPQGPMAQDHLMTPETLDADLIFPQTLTMSMRKVPSCCGSHANNTTKGLRLGSIIFGKIPTCQLPINLSQFIARQALIPMRLTVPFCSVKTTITVRQSKSLEDREIGK